MTRDLSPGGEHARGPEAQPTMLTRLGFKAPKQTQNQGHTCPAWSCQRVLPVMKVPPDPQAEGLTALLSSG